jgi:hypothetical protein
MSGGYATLMPMKSASWKERLRDPAVGPEGVHWRALCL